MLNKQTSAINKIIIDGMKQSDIALKVGLTKPRISQIKNWISCLEINPKILNNQVVCSKCELPDNLVFNKNKKTGSFHTLVCKNCNRKIKIQNSLNNKTVSEKFNPEELSILLIKGAELFELLTLTTDAQMYLNNNKDLMNVIKKW